MDSVRGVDTQNTAVNWSQQDDEYVVSDADWWTNYFKDSQHSLFEGHIKTSAPAYNRTSQVSSGLYNGIHLDCSLVLNETNITSYLMTDDHATGLVKCDCTDYETTDNGTINIEGTVGA